MSSSSAGTPPNSGVSGSPVHGVGANSSQLRKSASQHFSRSEIITLLVGHPKTEFRVHKDRLCDASKYFRARLNNPRYVEATSGIVPLLEEKPDDVERFVEWLYTRQYRSTTNLDQQLDYRFATTIRASAYANAVIDLVRTDMRKGDDSMTLFAVLDAYQLGLRGTEMALLARKSCVWLFMDASEDGLATLEECRKAVEEEYGEDPICREALLDILGDMISYRRQSWTHPAEWTGCQFHLHDDGDTCPAAASNSEPST